MRLGIEFLSSLKVVNGVAVYTGGTNYAKGILSAIIDDETHKDAFVCIYLPSNFSISEEDKGIFDSSRFEIEYVDSILDIENVDVLFMPQVNGTFLSDIIKLKKKRRGMKIYATLHDRNHNLSKFDWYDRLYYTGLKRTGLPLVIEHIAKKLHLILYI